MVGKGGGAGQGLKDMSGKEASTVNVEETDANKGEGKTSDKCYRGKDDVWEGGGGQADVC